jgi:serine protease AprX
MPGVHHHRPGERSRWRRVALVAAIPLALTVTSATPSPDAPSAPSAPTTQQWAGTWLSGTAAGTGTSLDVVRSSIGADTGAAAALTGKGVGIALIDTGVTPVPGLPAGRIVNGPDLSFESQDPDLRYLDAYGHGTHLAGIMIADDPATGTHGVAPGATVTSVKAGTANGAVDVSQVIAAIDWVVKNRNHDPANPIRVLNLAYGTGGNPGFYSDPVQFAVEKAWQAGIVVVASAGNQGPAAGKLMNPATDPWIISVGAATTGGTPTVTDDVIAPFTNTDASRPLDVLAPGDSIRSLRVPGSMIDTYYPQARNGTALFQGSGTSQAAAVVSAAVALLLEAKPELTPDQVKYLIKSSATYLTTDAQRNGGGFELNVNAALAERLRKSISQPPKRSSGSGLLEDARGTSHIVDNGVALTGEATVFGPWNSSTWAARAANQTSWSGGTWMGYGIAGSGWTGYSWASKTWGAATWTARPWGSSGTWVDPAWAGRGWSGRFWAGGTWSARFWASDDWHTAGWR